MLKSVSCAGLLYFFASLPEATHEKESRYSRSPIPPATKMFAMDSRFCYAYASTDDINRQTATIDSAPYQNDCKLFLANRQADHQAKLNKMRTNYCDRSLASDGPVMWNSLPAAL